MTNPNTLPPDPDSYETAHHNTDGGGVDPTLLAPVSDKERVAATGIQVTAMQEAFAALANDLGIKYPSSNEQ